jgi:hypothetical protein
MKMQPVIREIRAELNSGADSTKAEAINSAVKRWKLDTKETQYLCRHFSILTEDLK